MYNLVAGPFMKKLKKKVKFGEFVQVKKMTSSNRNRRTSSAVAPPCQDATVSVRI